MRDHFCDFLCHLLRKYNHNIDKFWGPHTKENCILSSTNDVARNNVDVGRYSDSELNRLEGFHVIDGILPCIGHDLFQGVVAHDLLLFIKSLIDKNWFFLIILNGSINAFLLAVKDRRDKPV